MDDAQTQGILLQIVNNQGKQEATLGAIASRIDAMDRSKEREHAQIYKDIEHITEHDANQDKRIDDIESVLDKIKGASLVVGGVAGIIGGAAGAIFSAIFG